MGERKQKRKQKERLVELANELKKRELEISRKSQTIDELKKKLGERERQIAAAEAAKPMSAHPVQGAAGSVPGKSVAVASAAPKKPSAEIVAEINEVLKTIFWDYSHSVQEISGQISTVTAAALCAAVTCILENRSFDIKDVFLREIQEILRSESLDVTNVRSPESAVYHPVAPPVKQLDSVPVQQPPSWRSPMPTPEPVSEHRKAEPGHETEQTQSPVSAVPAKPPLPEEEILRIGSVIEFQKLGDQGFRDDETIVRVELPEGIQYLPGNYFYDCVNLKEVWLPDSLLEIGPYSFYGCKSLTTVHIGEKSALREIGEYAFAMCEKLTSFMVPSQVESIGTSVFRFCSSLEDVLISKNSKLRTLGSHLFHSCISLDKIQLPKSITVIPTSMCYGCLALREVIAKGVDTIEDYAFYGNTSLRSVKILSMKTIASQAFEGCDPALEIDYRNR